MYKRCILVVALLLAAGSVYAESEAIEARQKLMKGFGAASKPLGDMLKGAMPFDAAIVKTSLATISENAKKLPSLFPDDSKEGGKTEALPIIWTEKDKFNAGFAKLDTDATAASAAITDEASFKAQTPKVLGNCKACHDVYRLKK